MNTHGRRDLERGKRKPGYADADDKDRIIRGS
jgi:hypothetical protein